MNEDRGLIPSSLGETVHWEKSPFVQGFMAGVKGALMGALGGAGVQGLRGKDPLTGAIVGGLGAGILAGLSKATSQKVENVSTEENMRYHVERMKDREPFVFMPPPSLLSRVMSRVKGAPGAH